MTITIDPQTRELIDSRLSDELPPADYVAKVRWLADRLQTHCPWLNYSLSKLVQEAETRRDCPQLVAALARFILTLVDEMHKLHLSSKGPITAFDGATTEDFCIAMWVMDRIADICTEAAQLRVAIGEG